MTTEHDQIAEDAPNAVLDTVVADGPRDIEKRPPGPSDDLNTLWNVARQVARTDFVPERLRGKEDKVFATMLQGRALGVDPMTALREIWISPQGSPELSAELQAALVRKAGHKVTGEASREGATLTGVRGDTNEEMTVTFTLEDAAEQGLVEIKDGKPYARSANGKPLPWERFTEQMLWHRAMTTLVRRLFSDVMVGDGL